MLTFEDLIDKQDALKARIVTNYGQECCCVYPIYDEDIETTQGLVKDAIGQIVLREMRISKRHRDGRKDWQERVSHVYIWPNGTTTKIPDVYEKAILSWLAS